MHAFVFLPLREPSSGHSFFPNSNVILTVNPAPPEGLSDCNLQDNQLWDHLLYYYDNDKKLCGGSENKKKNKSLTCWILQPEFLCSNIMQLFSAEPDEWRCGIGRRSIGWILRAGVAKLFNEGPQAKSRHLLYYIVTIQNGSNNPSDLIWLSLCTNSRSTCQAPINVLWTYLKSICTSQT